MQIVPFTAEGNLPAYMTGGTPVADINKDIATGASFPTMSIKGKVFAISRDGQRKVLTKPDEPDEVAQSIGVVIGRANMNAKVFYLKKFKEEDSEGARPDCYSYDGVTPSPNSPNAQAKKCAICPHNVWGSRVGDGDAPDGSERKGKACSDNGRLAISAPDKLDWMLLRVPPASLKSVREAVKLISQRSLPNGGKLPYNAVVFKISFDKDSASPKLMFKPVGLLDDATYQEVNSKYDDEIVRAIVGVDDHGVEGAAPEAKPAMVDTDELDAALAARGAADKAKASATPAKPTAAAPTPPPEPEEDEDEKAARLAMEAAEAAKKKLAAKKAAAKKADAAAAAAPKAEPEQATKPTPAAPAPSAGASNLLADLDGLLGSKDD